MKENKTIQNKVFESLGEVSMCWLPNTGNLQFDSTNAERIGNELMKEIKKELRINYLKGLTEYTIWADYIPNGNQICDEYQKELDLLNK